jgi:hypothetical protein
MTHKETIEVEDGWTVKDTFWVERDNSVRYLTVIL